MQNSNNNILPKGWINTILGEICTVVRGGSPRPMGDPKYFNGTIPFIKIADITKISGNTVYDSKTHVNEEGAKKSRLLGKGSLILTNSGTVCVPKFLGVDACIHDGFVSFLNLLDDFPKDYLFYFFNYIRPKIIQENKQGITQVNLNTTIVNEININLPPLPEQHRIVAKIEELFSSLDAGIEALRNAREQLKTYRQAVLMYAFEGRLTEEWRKNQEDLPTGNELLNLIKEEREKHYQKNIEKWKRSVKEWELNGKQGGKPNKPRKLIEVKSLTGEDLEELAELPENFIWVRLGDLVWSVKDGPHYSPKYSDSGIPFISGGNIRPSGIDFTKVKYIPKIRK